MRKDTNMFSGDKSTNEELANPDKLALKAKNSPLNNPTWLEMSLFMDAFWFVIWLSIWTVLNSRHTIGFWSIYLIGIIIISILRYLLNMLV
jgi:hypothetical protein